MDEHGVVRFSAVNGDQLNARSSDFQLGGAVYGCVRLKIPHIFKIEALAEEVFADGLRRVDLTGDFFLIVASGIEAGFRVQTAKIGLSADMVPMRVCNEDGGQLRQIRRIGTKRLVCRLGGVGPGSRVDPDQLPPIVGNDEIVFGELETGERIDAVRNNFGNAARRKSMTGQWVFYKWGDERYRHVEAFVAALAEIVPGFGLVAIGESELSQAKLHFPQPADVGRFGDVRGAPCQIVLRGLLLMEEAWELGTDNAGNPVHHEDLTAGELLGLVQYCHGVFHVADAEEQGNRGGVLGPQQTDGAQVERFLRVGEAGCEFIQPRGEELGTLRLPVGIGVRAHEKKQQLRILWRGGAVYRFQVFELRTGRAGLIPVGAPDRHICSRPSQETRAERHYCQQKNDLSHESNPFRELVRPQQYMYIHIIWAKKSGHCRRVRDSGDASLHLFPT